MTNSLKKKLRIKFLLLQAKGEVIQICGDKFPILCNNIKSYLFTTLLCMFLTSCIQVQDIGPYWEKGIIDPALEGAFSDGDNCLMFVLDGKDYRVIDNGIDGGSIFRILDIEHSKFAMFLEGEGAYILLVKYSISGDGLTLYRPNKYKKAEFSDEYPNSEYPNSNVKITDGEYVLTIVIPVLNEASVALLQDVSNNPDYWQPSIYRRVDRCEAPDAQH